MSPVAYDLPINPDNTFMQYAKYDQLSSDLVVKKFILKNNIVNAKVYSTSHATILLSGRLYRDYATFLDSVAFRW